jgi:hypothetical protein
VHAVITALGWLNGISPKQRQGVAIASFHLSCVYKRDESPTIPVPFADSMNEPSAKPFSECTMIQY